MATPKPKVLVLTSTYPRWAGDTEPDFVHQLCRRLATSFDLMVLAPHAQGASRREQLDGVQVARFRYLPESMASLAYDGGMPAKIRRNPLFLLQSPFFVLASFAAAWRAVREHGAVAVHAHWLLPQGLIAAALKKIFGPRLTVICTAHGSDLHSFNTFPFGAAKRWTLASVDALAVVSSAMLAQALELGAGAGAVQVLPMGVDTRTFSPPSASRGSDLLFVGRLVPGKGVEHLLRALPSIHAAFPQCRLIIAGDGPEKTGLQALAGSLGISANVEFRGAVRHEELPALYGAAAATVFPSTAAEGFGLVVVEAQACGCPVVASDIPAVRDTIEDGRSGLLVPPGESEAIARAVIRILGDPRLAAILEENGRSAAQRFDWDQVALRYRALIERAARALSFPQVES